MNDRELLEMAAKAAGIKGEWSDRGQCIVITEIGMSWEHWRPLDDDGDALRLAVKLDIHVKRYAGSTTAQELCSTSSWTEHDHWGWNKDDPMRSTRRAITTAAAEIGKAM